jgi:transcription antitermination factor NusG
MSIRRVPIVAHEVRMLARMWFVVQTNDKDERLAEGYIRELGIETYLPQYTQRVRRSGKKPELVKKALFPGYLFVQFDWDNPNWPRIFSRRGVRGVIQSAGRPKPVPEKQMAFVRELAEENEGVVLEAVPLTKDQVVKIIEGPLSGFSAKITHEPKGARVALEYNMLGKSLPIILPREAVAPIANQ